MYVCLCMYVCMYECMYVCVCMYVCYDLLNQNRLMDLLTAHTQNIIFSISTSLSLSLSLSQHLLFTVLRTATLGMKWGVRAPTQDSKLFLLVGPQ